MEARAGHGPGPAVLVTGATGVVGPALIRELAARGYRVRALVRRSPPAGILPETTILVPGDLDDRCALSSAVKGADVVVHLAAMLHRYDPPPELRREIWRVNVEGTRNLARAAAGAAVSRLVLFSSISVYGPGDGRSVRDESSPLNPDGWYAESKVEAEREALAVGPAVVLRMAAIHGPGMRGNYVRLMRAMARGVLPLLGDGRNRRTLVHLQDACRAALLAAESDRAGGRVFNVSDGSTPTLLEIVAAIRAAMGRPVRVFRVHPAPVRAAAGLLEGASRLLGLRSPFSWKLVDKLTEDVAVDSSLIRRELGFRPSFDLMRGWRDTVAAHSLGGPG